MKAKKTSTNSRDAPYTYVRSETSLFEEPGYEVSRTGGQVVIHHPITAISDRRAPLQFLIKSNDQHYVDLRSIKLKIRARVLRSDGSVLKSDDVVSPCQNWLHSMFKSVQCYFNDVLITPTSENYGYKAYIETLLGFGKEAKKSQAACALFEREDDMTVMDETVDDGFKRRYEKIKESKVVEMVGRPFIDICAATQYLLPGIDIRLNFDRASPEFSLMTTASESFIVDIMDAKLYVEKVNLLPSLALDHIKMLESGKPMQMALRKVEVRSFTIPPGTSQVSNENILTGLIPYRVIIAILPSQAYIGSYKTNPFVFANNSLSYINLSVNGENVNTPLELDYDRDSYVLAYDNLFRGLDIDLEDIGIDISLSDFKETCALYVYNIAQVREGFVPPKHGNVSLELKFKAAKSEALTVLTYLEWPAVLQCDRYKNISFLDFNNY